MRHLLLSALSLLILCLAESRNTSRTSPSWHVPVPVIDMDSVWFSNTSAILTPGYTVTLHYVCSRSCVLCVELLAPLRWRTNPLVFHHCWTNHVLGTHRRHTLSPTVPASMLYQRDFYTRSVEHEPTVILRAWLHWLDWGRGHYDYRQAPVRTFTLLKTLPPSQRHHAQHTRCLSWGAELMWSLSRDRDGWCPHETDTVQMLSFPVASTGERFGVVRRFQPFVNEELESQRRCEECGRVTFSVWIYLLGWCKNQRCSILQHVDPHGMFHTPLVLLTDTGDIVLQVKMTSGGEQAFRSNTALSLRMWHQLDVFMDGYEVVLWVTSLQDGEKRVKHKYTYRFHGNVWYDDTHGLFVIGGGRFMPGIRGYFGPIRYQRLGSEQVTNPLSPAVTLAYLDDTHHVCEELRLSVTAFMRALRENEDAEGKHTCRWPYSSLRNRVKQQRCAPVPRWDRQWTDLHHRLLISTLGKVSDWWDRKAILRFGERVFDHVQAAVARGDSHGDTLSALVPVLRVSSCCGSSRATLLLAAMLLSGFGIPADNAKGHVYSLIGGQADDRLALMHLGYKHTQGLDGFPRDYDVAYGYYSNVAKQSCVDRWMVQQTEQYWTEPVLLTDDEALRAHTDVSEDLLHYLTYQADRGDVQSQKTLAQVMFWGQRGVNKDLQNALQWYKRSAMEKTDARAVYDYAILLLRGQGLQRNITLGRHLMEQAATMGLKEAVNGLGWYYHTLMADSVTAVKYFEAAALNGSADAVYNLGLFYLSGSYPGKSGRNQSAAFQHFLSASLFGHLEATVETAWYYSTGVLAAASYSPERAVRLLNTVCEQNGYLGNVLRKALSAYRRGSRSEALVSYLLAAETGMSVAQINAAHLCEQDHSCGVRYYNYSTYNYTPHPAGLLKMGDYYYNKRNLSFSISMYTRAAYTRSPQALFNLAVMVEEGHQLPPDVLTHLGVSREEQQDKSVIAEKLYDRCRQYEDVSPCVLALYRVRLRRAVYHTTLSSLAYIIGSTLTIGLLARIIERNMYTFAYTEASERRRMDTQAEDSWAVSVLGECVCVTAAVLLGQIL